MEYCPHCMHPAQGDRCPHCGGEMKWENSPALLPLGTVLSGGGLGRSYQVGAPLGQGGFGVTYIALDLTTGQRVAIKEYFPVKCAQRAPGGQVEPKPGQAALYEGGRYSFLQEAQMLASLEGMPAVVQGLDYLEANGTAYLVMEYLDGTPLYRIVNEKGKILAEDLLPRLRPLMLDIGKLHARGVIHRDISPDNIMWMPDGTLKLLDFGCARSMEDGKSMTLAVKKGFAPVEQYQTRGQGAYTDVYALAATIYYCLTGVIPPESPTRMMDGVELKSPIALGAALTPEEESALLWGLTVEPKARPANMDVFALKLFPIEAPHPDTTITITTTGGAISDASSSTSGRQPSVPEPQPKGPGLGQRLAACLKKKWKLLAGILSGALVVVLAVALVVSLASGRKKKNDDYQTPDQTAADRQPSVGLDAGGEEPPEETQPQVLTGTTEEGFTYLIREDGAVITGYTGDFEENDGVLVFPDEIDGTAVTGIADSAFAGQTRMESAMLPVYLEVIEEGAFRGCSNLRDIYIYRNAAVAGGVFDGCNRLRCVVLGADGVGLDGWGLPEGYALFSAGMDTGAGGLKFVDVDDGGVIYAVTDQDQAVLMDIPSSAEEVTIPEMVYGYPVTWLYDGAFDHAAGGAVTIWMSENLTFSPELVNMASWNVKDGVEQTTMAFNWVQSCKLAQEINGARGSAAEQIQPQRELVEAAMVRARELSQLYELGQRPDGSSWTTCLDEAGVDWSYGWTVANRASLDKSDGLEKLYERTVEALAPAEEDYDNAYYTGFAIAQYIDRENDMDYVICFGTIK